MEREFRINAYNNLAEGYLQKGRAKTDGFYCLRKQRDPDNNPGNIPCPDTDKCYLCGNYTQAEK